MNKFKNRENRQKKKDNGETKTGTVVENLPNAMFRIKYKEEENEEIAYLAGKMKLYKIRVLIGDTVEVKIDPYGGKGRIIKRLRI